MLLTKTVKVRWNKTNKKCYEERGYKFNKGDLGKEFEVKVDDLELKSNARIKVKCDNEFCNKELMISYQYYNQVISNNEDNRYYCSICNRILGKRYDSRGIVITLNNQNERICNAPNCNRKYEACGYCINHYRHVRKYGHILERTYRDRNIIIENDEYAEIILQNINCEETGRALIDKEDIEKCKPYSWHLCRNGYVTAFIDDKQIYLHRYLMNVNNSKVQVDHINRNRSDNRKVNLRLCTNAENGKNKRILDSNTSGYVGIRYEKRRGHWYASIRVNRNDIYLGSSTNLEEVIELREKAELQYFGEFSPRYKELIIKYPEYHIYLLENNLIYNNTYN